VFAFGDCSVFCRADGAWSAVTAIKNEGAEVASNATAALPYLPETTPEALPVAVTAGSALFVMTDGVGDPLIWRSCCQVGRRSLACRRLVCAVAVRGSRGGASGLSWFGGGARLIFEGCVPHDPVFVAVRGLGAGAARVPGGGAGCP
jgi:hypothetical protein